MFTLNGRKIIISDEEEPEIYIDWDIDKPLYPYVSMNYGSSVVAKVRPQMWEWWVGVELPQRRKSEESLPTESHIQTA